MEVDLKAVSNTDLLKMYIDYNKKISDLTSFIERDVLEKKYDNYSYHKGMFDASMDIFNSIEREILSRMMGMEID